MVKRLTVLSFFIIQSIVYCHSQEITFCNVECSSIEQKNDVLACLSENKGCSLEVQNILTKIQEKRPFNKLPDGFRMLECIGHNNCSATTDQNDNPIIIYDPFYLQVNPNYASISNVKNINVSKNWWAYAILAHEIGHFAYMDLFKNGNVSDVNKRRKMELAADKFAGLILGRLGASSETVTKLCNNFQEDACNYHPSRSERLTAMLSGLSSSGIEDETIDITPNEEFFTLEDWFAEVERKFREDLQNNDMESAIQTAEEEGWSPDIYGYFANMIGVHYALDLNDGKNARKWLRKAANVDNPKAMYSLANIYLEGTLLPFNYNKVKMWLEKSAALDYEPALEMLKNL